MATVRIPAPLRPYAAGNSNIPVSGNTVSAALADLTRQYPDLHQHLFEGNNLRSFVTVFLNQEDVRHLQGQQTAIAGGDTLLIIPSIAGGGPDGSGAAHV